MIRRIAKVTMLVIMAAGIVFSLVNFIALESEAYAIWQDLETGKDPVTGGNFVRCFATGQACVTVYPFED